MIWRPYKRIRELERQLERAMLSADKYRWLRQHYNKTGKAKVAYSAEAAIDTAQRLSKIKMMPYQPYRCDICDGFHVGARHE